MVAPHPEFQRRISNTRNIVEANKSQYVPSLSTKYPEDYIDLDTHNVLTDTQPWIEEMATMSSISSSSLDTKLDISNIKSCWGAIFLNNR